MWKEELWYSVHVTYEFSEAEDSAKVGGCLEKLDSWTSMVEVLWIERLVTNSY